MKTIFHNLAGKTFGRCTVIDRAGGQFWNLRCSCGETFKARTCGILIAGPDYSCKECRHGRHQTHVTHAAGERPRAKRLTPLCDQCFGMSWRVASIRCKCGLRFAHQQPKTVDDILAERYWPAARELA